MSELPRPFVAVSSAGLRAEIDPHGAQLSVLKDREGRDLLWDGDPAVWSGRAPILFPIVGALAHGSYRLGSASYQLPRHGFARNQRFDVASSTASCAVFILRQSEATLPVYPFKFELQVRFEVSGAALTITSTVRNSGDSEMPASVGYHPALRWPLPYGQSRAAHFIEFAAEEPAPIRRIDAAGLLEAQPHPTPVVKRRLALDDALFKDDVVIFDKFTSRSVLYGAADGPKVEVRFPDAPYLGIWSKPGAGFVCIEPWHGVTDAEGFTGDFTQKEGIFVLKPEAALITTMAITLIQ